MDAIKILLSLSVKAFLSTKATAEVKKQQKGQHLVQHYDMLRDLGSQTEEVFHTPTDPQSYGAATLLPSQQETICFKA